MVPPARRLAFGFASVHQAFMNQKIMPISATQIFVPTGVGKTGRGNSSRFTRCVRMPGWSEVMRLW